MKNKFLMELLKSFPVEVWELSALSGAAACILHCGDYRTMEGLSFACKDTCSMLGIATMLEEEQICTLKKTRPMTLSRFKTGMFLQNECFGTIKVLWFLEGSLKRYFGLEIFDGQYENIRTLTVEGAAFQRLAVFMGRNFKNPISNVIVDLLALCDIVGDTQFAKLCETYARATEEKSWYIPRVDLHALAEMSLEHYCIPSWRDKLSAKIDVLAETMEIFIEDNK